VYTYPRVRQHCYLGAMGHVLTPPSGLFLLLVGSPCVWSGAAAAAGAGRWIAVVGHAGHAAAEASHVKQAHLHRSTAQHCHCTYIQ